MALTWDLDIDSDAFQTKANAAADAAETFNGAIKETASVVDEAGLDKLATAAQQARDEVSRLSRAQKELNQGDVVDVSTYKSLSDQIGQAKAKLAGYQQQLTKSGAAGRRAPPKPKDAKGSSPKDAAGLAKSAGDLQQILQGIRGGGGLTGALGNLKSAGPAVAGIGVAIGAAAGAFYLAGKGIQKAISVQYYAAARLQAIQARFNFGVTQMFRKVDTRPFLSSLDKIAAMFDSSTNSGRIMGEYLQRAFKLVGSAVEAITPVVEYTFAGAIAGAIYLETGFIRLRTTIKKTGAALLDAIPENVFEGIGRDIATVGKSVDELRSGFSELGSSLSDLYTQINNAGAGAAAFGVGVRYVSALFTFWSTTIAGVGRVLGDVGQVLSGLGQVISGVMVGDWNRVWKGAQTTVIGAFNTIIDAGSFAVRILASQVDAIGKIFGVDLGLTKNFDKAISTIKAIAAKAASGDTTKPGKDMGDGIIKGLDEKNGPIFEAGKKASEAAIKGMEAGAQIASPSRAARVRVGRQLGAGEILGMRDMASAVQNAAEEYMVPDFAALARSGGGGSGAANVNGIPAGAQKVAIFQAGSVVVQTQDQADGFRRVVGMMFDEVLDQR